MEILKIFNFHKGDKVFIVNRQDYPNTVEDENLCIEKANSRVDECEYTASSNNCESYVNWVFTNDNSSKQSTESSQKHFSALVLDNSISFFKYKLPWVLEEMKSLTKRMLGKLDAYLQINLEQKWDEFIDMMQENFGDKLRSLYTHSHTRYQEKTFKCQFLFDILMLYSSGLKNYIAMFSNGQTIIFK